MQSLPPILIMHKKILGKITLDQKKLLKYGKYRGNTAIMHTMTRKLCQKIKIIGLAGTFLIEPKKILLLHIG